MSEKQLAPADEASATTGTNGYYVSNIHGQPGNPATGSTPAYTETDNNPLPQLVFDDALPEVVKPAIQPDHAGEDFSSRPIPVDSGSEEQAPSPDAAKPTWYKRKSMMIIAIASIVAVVVILAVLFGTLAGLGLFRNDQASPTGQDQIPTSTSSLGPTATTTSQASSSAGTPLSTSSPATITSSSDPAATHVPQCVQDSNYMRNISLVTGNVDKHGLGWTLPSAKSREDCCTICYVKTATGCNMWVWDGDNGVTPCTIVMAYFGDKRDGLCPYGHTNETAFTIKGGGLGIGSAGPCGDPGMEVSS
jgi:FlaG/FlaF family flagellin (archaellin)